MKKSILIMGGILATFSLTAYSALQKKSSNPNPKEVSCMPAAPDQGLLVKGFAPVVQFMYHIDTRFNTTITKEKLLQATSILEILPEEATQSLVGYSQVKVGILGKDGEIIATGKNELLNSAQIELMREADYATNFYIRSNCFKQYSYAGFTEPYDLVYYISVTPEKEARYIPGYPELIQYLKDNSKAETAIVREDQLKPGKISFTVTSTGSITDVALESSSGYPSIDQKMKQLIANLPGAWTPAEDEQGQKVHQQLCFSFGMIGC